MMLHREARWAAVGLTGLGIMAGCSDTTTAQKQSVTVELSAPSPPSTASASGVGIASGGLAQIATAGTAARALSAAGMSPHPWDQLPSGQAVVACFTTDGYGGTTAAFVDAHGHRTPAPDFPPTSCLTGATCAGSLFKP